MVESVNLQDVWKLIKNSWMVILAVAIVVSLLFAIYTVLFVPKMYTSSVTIYVSNAANSSTGNVNSGDLTASKLLANTSVQLLAKEPARAKICDKLEENGYTDITPGRLGGYVTIKQTSETELLTVYAVTEDRELSAEICNAYAEIAPDYLKEIIEAGSFKAIDEAKPASAASSPDVPRKAAIGGFVGAFLTFGVYFIIFLFDNSVKDGDSLKKRLNLPVLGEIPAFSGNKKA